MSALLGITLAVWILWAVLFCLGLCAAAARPIPKPASLRTWSASSGQLTIAGAVTSMLAEHDRLHRVPAAEVVLENTEKRMELV
jgi:hypothetical protein